MTAVKAVSEPEKAPERNSKEMSISVSFISKEKVPIRLFSHNPDLGFALKLDQLGREVVTAAAQQSIADVTCLNRPSAVIRCYFDYGHVARHEPFDRPYN